MPSQSEPTLQLEEQRRHGASLTAHPFHPRRERGESDFMVCSASAKSLGGRTVSPLAQT